jgi:hypothetical protein
LRTGPDQHGEYQHTAEPRRAVRQSHCEPLPGGALRRSDDDRLRVARQSSSDDANDKRADEDHKGELEHRPERPHGVVFGIQPWKPVIEPQRVGWGHTPHQQPDEAEAAEDGRDQAAKDEPVLGDLGITGCRRRIKPMQFVPQRHRTQQKAQPGQVNSLAVADAVGHQHGRQHFDHDD